MTFVFQALALLGNEIVPHPRQSSPNSNDPATPLEPFVNSDLRVDDALTVLSMCARKRLPAQLDHIEQPPLRG
ncbi:unnamed protein product [Dicrocoelium dendriticum]|nr:unnamed protein product [Dicrocoelium dendriticum]